MAAMTRMTKTKIIVTIGPASCDEQTLTAFIEEGVDVLRLNFSHGTVSEHHQVLTNIRQVCQRTGAIVAVMGDLCGPKLRVGRIEGGRFTIEPGETITIQRQLDVGTRQRIGTNYPPLVDELEPQARIFIDDGNVRLRVVDKRADELVCTCELGGVIADHKGINLPDTALSTPALTHKDRADLEWAIANDLDYVALSFVRRPEDLQELRAILDERHSDIRVVAKIEKPQAIDHLSGIINEADAVLVARGDLGVEMDVARVPLLQKDITLRCQQVGKPVIIATQMLQSMIDSATPTRAEVSDVANAIFDAADAVMLSAESAVGKYPVQAVRMINRIARETEAFLARQPAAGLGALAAPESLRVTSAVAHGASLVARELNAKLVAVWSETGNTARLLSKYRLPQPIVTLSPHERVCRQVAMNYGVIPVHAAQPANPEHMLRKLDELLTARGLAEPNDLILVIAGTQLHRPGATNNLLIHIVGRSEFCEVE